MSYESGYSWLDQPDPEPGFSYDWDDTPRKPEPLHPHLPPPWSFREFLKFGIPYFGGLALLGILAAALVKGLGL